MGFWSKLGTSIATSGGDIAANTIGGLINAELNKALGDYERQENYKYNEKAAEQADRRARAQFKDMYSYGAQVQEMKKAGLNPALMYGGASGQGGATAPQGLGAGGVQKGLSGMNLMSMAEIGVMKSQAQLNEAEAEGKRIENQNKQDAINADIALKLSQAGLNKAAEAYKNIQTQREEVALHIDESTTDDQIKARNAAAEKTYWESWIMYYESMSKNAKSQVDLQTIQTRVDQELANYKETLQNIKVGESIVKLNDATITQIAHSVAQGWYNADTSRMSYEAQKQFFQDQITNAINKLEQDKTIAEEQIAAMKQGQWLKFATDIFGSITNMAGTLGAAGIRAAGDAIPF